MKANTSKYSVSLLLHDIRSIHNVGSIFRTADAFGVSKIYISGVTPAPIDRFGRARADLAKVALGAEKTIPWELAGASLSTAVSFVKKIKKEKTVIISLEQSEKSLSCAEIARALPSGADTLLSLGNEVTGVDSSLLSLSNYIAEIPMKGKKESLNVSVATGIALFGIFG